MGKWIVKIGDTVKVNHHLAIWEGKIVSMVNTGEGIEYEVSNSPLGKFMGKWFPLLWKHELKKVLNETVQS